MTTLTAILEGPEENILIVVPYNPGYDAQNQVRRIASLLSSQVACTMVTEDLGHSVRKTYLGRKSVDQSIH